MDSAERFAGGMVALLGAAAAGVVIGILLTGAALVLVIAISLMWVDDQ